MRVTRNEPGTGATRADEALPEQRDAFEVPSDASDPVPPDVPNDSGVHHHRNARHDSRLEALKERLQQTAAELEWSRARNQELYSDAPLGLLTIGVQGRILNCNQRAAQLFRLQVSTACRRRVTEFMSAENAQVFTREIAQLYASKESRTFECEVRRADGTQFWAQIFLSLTREPVDGSYLARLAISDESNRKRMRDDAARLVAIVASSDQAIISQDLDGTITSWNPGAEHLFGYSAHEAIGHGVQLIVPNDRMDEEESLRNRIQRGASVAEESVRQRRDGTRIPVFVSASPILDEYGRVIGVSKILRDISEQIAARPEVTRLLEDLRDADRRKDDFIATLAHELRNPLAPIRNAAAVMRYVPDLNPKLQWCRDVIDRQVSHMAALLEDLLDISRLTRDKITLRRDRIELGTAIAQAIEINRPLIESRGHKLSVELVPHPIEVEGDLTRLTQVFGNLLNNAAKYTNTNGEISVTVELQDAQVVTRVRDSGIGIHPENIDGIFDLFTQVDPTREGPEGGLGIGLALVKGLVERHGGTISAHSEGLGFGSEFVVSLPIARSLPRENTGDHAIIGVRHATPHPLRVLVVDDNVDAAESLAMILSSRRHDVRTAHDGASALEMAADFRPHLMILDIGMPKLSGFDVARHIRLEPWGQHMVLAACTGWGQPEDLRRSHEAGFDHHLVKPVSPSAVLQLLNTIADTAPG